MSVEVVSIPEQGYAPTMIPEKLVEHFAAEGKRLTLTSAWSMNVTMRMSEGRRVVLVEDIPEALFKEVKYFFDRPSKYDGELHVGDCVLVAQTVENYHFHQQQIEERRKFIENVDEAAALNQKAQEYLRNDSNRLGISEDTSRTWVDYHSTNSSKVSDHVKGGADLAAEIAAAAVASGKKK
jgi:hypothetical protein